MVLNLRGMGEIVKMRRAILGGGGNSKSTSQKYPVSASSEVFKICSKVTVRNVSDRLVSELLSDVGGQLLRNVSGEVFSGMVPNVGRGDSRVRNVSVSGSKFSTVSNFKSLYGRG